MSTMDYGVMVYDTNDGSCGTLTNAYGGNYTPADVNGCVANPLDNTTGMNISGTNWDGVNTGYTYKTKDCSKIAIDRTFQAGCNKGPYDFKILAGTQKYPGSDLFVLAIPLVPPNIKGLTDSEIAKLYQPANWSKTVNIIINDLKTDLDLNTIVSSDVQPRANQKGTNDWQMLYIKLKISTIGEALTVTQASNSTNIHTAGKDILKSVLDKQHPGYFCDTMRGCIKTADGTGQSLIDCKKFCNVPPSSRVPPPPPSSRVPPPPPASPGYFCDTMSGCIKTADGTGQSLVECKKFCNTSPLTPPPDDSNMYLIMFLIIVLALLLVMGVPQYGYKMYKNRKDGSSQLSVPPI